MEEETPISTWMALAARNEIVRQTGLSLTSATTCGVIFFRSNHFFSVASLFAVTSKTSSGAVDA